MLISFRTGQHLIPPSPFILLPFISLCLPTMSSRKIILFMLMLSHLLANSACSYQAIYDNIQSNRLRNCEEQPWPQWESCKAQYQLDYEEYERQRQALMIESNPAQTVKKDLQKN